MAFNPTIPGYSTQGKSFSRTAAFPLESYEIWDSSIKGQSFEDLKKYASNTDASKDPSYIGQKVAFIDRANNRVVHYGIEIDGTLKELGADKMGVEALTAADAGKTPKAFWVVDTPAVGEEGAEDYEPEVGHVEIRWVDLNLAQYATKVELEALEEEVGKLPTEDTNTVTTITPADASLTIVDSITDDEDYTYTAKVNISDAAGNSLTLDEKGLYVPEVTHPEYTIAKLETPSEGSSATYELKKDNIATGDKIEIPVVDLSEYAKTADVEGLVAEEIGKKVHFSTQIVEEAPSVEDAKPGVLYLVADENAESGAYIEYMLVGEGETLAVEQIGSTKTDLSEYAKLTDLPGEDDFGVLEVTGKDAIDVTYAEADTAKQHPEVSLKINNNTKDGYDPETGRPTKVAQDVILSQAEDGLTAALASNIEVSGTVKAGALSIDNGKVIIDADGTHMITYNGPGNEVASGYYGNNGLKLTGNGNGYTVELDSDKLEMTNVMGANTYVKVSSDELLLGKGKDWENNIFPTDVLLRVNEESNVAKLQLGETVVTETELAQLNTTFEVGEGEEKTTLTLAEAVEANMAGIATNATNIATNAENIAAITEDIATILPIFLEPVTEDEQPLINPEMIYAEQRKWVLAEDGKNIIPADPNKTTLDKVLVPATVTVTTEEVEVEGEVEGEIEIVTITKLTGGTAGLLTPEEKYKLDKLVIDADGSVGVSGTISADNVTGLSDAIISEIIGPESTQQVEKGAQVNKIESIVTAEGALAINNKEVTIPTATLTALGLVKASEADNKISVGADGTMEVNKLTTDKLINGVEEFVLNGGNASTGKKA